MQQQVDINSPITVTFNKNANKTSVSKNLTILENGSQLDGSIDWNNNKTLVFTPDEPFLCNSRYTISISRYAEDSDGNIMNKDFESEFYAGADTSYPTVVNSDPSINSTQSVETDINIEITFSEQMNKELTENAFSISPTVAGYFSWSMNDSVLTYNTTNELDMNTQYHISVDVSAEDINGNELVKIFELYFYTGEIEFQNPELTNIYDSSYGLSPADNEVFQEGIINHGISKNDSITMKFNKPMKKASVESAFSTKPSITGTFDWINSQLVIFKPDNKLAIETIYTISLSDSAMSIDDRKLNKSFYSIICVDDTDSRYLSVGKIEGSYDCSLSTPFEELNPAVSPMEIDLGIATEQDYVFKIEITRDGLPIQLNSSTIFDNISVDTIGKPNANVAVITNISVNPSPDNSIQVELNEMKNSASGGDTYVYYLKIEGGENGIKDIDGNFLQCDYKFYFTDN